MLLAAFKHVFLLAAICGCASAAPVYLGGISFHVPFGGTTTGTSHEFRLFNWTGGVGGASYGLSTSITFSELSLRIDYDQGATTVLNEEAWLAPMVTQPVVQVPPDLNAAAPHPGMYLLYVDITKNIKRAVLTMKLSNTGPWNLQVGGTVTPNDPALDGSGRFTLEMLPTSGSYFAADSSDWPIYLNTAIPEPMTVALTGLGLVGIVLVRRRRRA